MSAKLEGIPGGIFLPWREAWREGLPEVRNEFGISVSSLRVPPIRQFELEYHAAKDKLQQSVQQLNIDHSRAYQGSVRRSAGKSRPLSHSIPGPLEVFRVSLLRSVHTDLRGPPVGLTGVRFPESGPETQIQIPVPLAHGQPV